MIHGRGMGYSYRNGKEWPIVYRSPFVDPQAVALAVHRTVFQQSSLLWHDGSKANASAKS